MSRIWIFTATLLLMVGGVFFITTGSQAALSQESTVSPTFDPTRLAQPSTVAPPSQADNGEQIYWGMCSACHGDRGQGLTIEWRSSYDPEMRDCWQSGCHGDDFASNSFKILPTGAPALVGPGKLTRFSNAFELQTFIHNNMPLFPTGSLTSEEALSLKKTYLFSLKRV